MSDSGGSKSILEFVKLVTPTSLEELNMEIAKKRFELKALLDLQGVACRILGVEVPLSPRTRKPRKPGEKSFYEDVDSKNREKREKMVEWLAENGPAQSTKLADECGIPSGSMGKLLDHPWFSKSAQGVHITTLARKEVL